MEELRAIHARRLWLDATSIIGLVIAVVTMTWIASNERNQIQNSIVQLSNDIKELSTDYHEMKASTKTYLTREQLIQQSLNWCLRVETLNKGFNCPPLALNGVQQ